MNTIPWTCPRSVWEDLLLELARRGGGERESGAFLLGRERAIEQVVYYDDLVPGCLDDGVVVFPGSGFVPLWDTCARTRSRVIADVHTHPFGAQQSAIDRRNPMIAQAGHLAIIVPGYALHPFRMCDLGLYEYAGKHHWCDLSGANVSNHFLIEDKS